MLNVKSLRIAYLGKCTDPSSNIQFSGTCWSKKFKLTIPIYIYARVYKK